MESPIVLDCKFPDKFLNKYPGHFLSIKYTCSLSARAIKKKHYISHLRFKKPSGKPQELKQSTSLDEGSAPWKTKGLGILLSMINKNSWNVCANGTKTNCSPKGNNGEIILWWEITPYSISCINSNFKYWPVLIFLQDGGCLVLSSQNLRILWQGEDHNNMTQLPQSMGVPCATECMHDTCMCTETSGPQLKVDPGSILHDHPMCYRAPLFLAMWLKRFATWPGAQDATY